MIEFPPGVQQAIEELRIREDPSTVQILHHDVQLRRMVAVWSLLGLRYGRMRTARRPDDRAVHATRDWIWHMVNLDRIRAVESIRGVMGFAFPAGAVLNRVIQSALAFPDGTINITAERYLKAKTGQILKRLQSAIPDKSDQKDRGGGKKR